MEEGPETLPQCLASDPCLLISPSILLMRIRSAIGFGVFIIVMKFLLPSVLSQGVSTSTAFLKGAEVSANVASGYVAQASLLHTPAEPPFPLPKAREDGP